MKNIKTILLIIIFSLAISLNLVIAYADPLIDPINNNILKSDYFSLEKADGEDHGEPGVEIEILDSDETGISFEIKTPLEDLSFKSVEVDGKEYLRISLSDWTNTAQSGAPALPSLLWKIGLPFGVEPTLNVIPGEIYKQSLSAPVLPNATSTFTEEKQVNISPEPELLTTNINYEVDPQIYLGQGQYPGVLAELVSDGVIRQQRVLGIGVFPVQYDAENSELIIYKSLKVEISFEGSILLDRTASIKESDVFEDFFKKELLNYELARSWRNSLLTQETQKETTLQIEPEIGITSTPWSPSTQAWRLNVKEEGIYQLSYGELSSAGLPVDSLDPRTFQIFNMGDEVTIDVQGEADGNFDTNDRILFYGQGINSKYTEDNVYWLTFGDTQGLRMDSSDVLPDSAETPDYYLESQYFEENTAYVTWLPGDENEERWYWSVIQAVSSPASWEYPFMLLEPYSEQATLTVSVVGYLDIAHHVEIYLNGSKVGDTGLWTGKTRQTLELLIDPGLLEAGENSIEVVCPNDSGYGYDVVVVDWINLNYPNTFLTDTDEFNFHFTESGTWKFEVDGFTTNQIVGYDISMPAAVQKLINYSVLSSGSEYYAAFEDTIDNEKHYWIGTSATIKSVDSIEEDVVSDLSSLSNGADHIIISHNTFIDQAITLSDFRMSQGLRTAVVDVQDVYDEFSYGILDPNAIHDFLAYAYTNWESPAPSYVVLMGDGHYDPKDFSGNGIESFIPPYLMPVDPWILETAADNRYVTLVGEDNMPDMMLGRISVNNTSEATNVVNKIIAYEQSPVDNDWQMNVMTVTDDGYSSISEGLMDCCIPDNYDVTKVYWLVTHTDLNDARDAIQEGFGNGGNHPGKLFVNYIGHGATNTWAGEGLLTTAYVADLQNVGQYPINLAMACMEGYFIKPDSTIGYHAVGEVITRADEKGSVASWSPTGYGDSVIHNIINQGFYNAYFVDGVNTVGEATFSGKFDLWLTGYSPEIIDTYLLFGDPATVIARSLKAEDDDYEVMVETTLNVSTPGVLDNDIDANGESLTAELVLEPNYGTLSLNANGAFTYTPDSGFIGLDSFKYRADNGTSLSNIAKVNISVYSEEGFPPVVTNIPDQTIEEGEEFTTISLDDYVSDQDNEDAEMSWTYFNNSELEISITNRIATINIPHADWNGSETITFRATDPDSNWDEDAATFTVTAVNDPPIVSDIPDQTIPEGSTFTSINLDDYVSDVDNLDDELIWVYSGNTALNVNISDRIASINIPYEDWFGSETILFSVEDPGGLSDSDSATFTVTSVNDPPVVDDIPDQTIDEGNSFATINLDNYVWDIDNADADLSWTYSGNIELVVEISDRIATVSIPDIDWYGSEVITFRATDPGLLYDEDPVNFTVTGINDPPVVVDDSYEVTTGETLIVEAPGLLGNDTDVDDDPLTAVWISDPANGDLTLNTDGSFTYTPDSGFIGSDNFTYTANDGTEDGNSATVSIEVNEESLPEISIELVEGWNLVSFYLQPEFTAIADVLSSIEGNYTLVYAWDAASASWLLYDPSGPSYVNDLSDLDHKMGFWINMLIEDTLIISGTQPATTEISLKTGWNLVGFPSIDVQALPGVLENHGVTDYNMVLAYHATDPEPWKIFDPSAPPYVNDLIEMIPGWGYWIEAETESTWSITYNVQ